MLASFLQHPGLIPLILCSFDRLLVLCCMFCVAIMWGCMVFSSLETCRHQWWLDRDSFHKMKSTPTWSTLTKSTSHKIVSHEVNFCLRINYWLLVYGNKLHIKEYIKEPKYCLVHMYPFAIEVIKKEEGTTKMKLQMYKTRATQTLRKENASSLW